MPDMQPLSRESFDALVAAALDTIPTQLAPALDNVAVVVEDEAEDDPDLLGVYEGVPLPERWEHSGVLPDRITIYRLTLCAACADEAELIEQIRVTVVHELAHHVGIDDDRLDELGWA